MDRKLDWNLHYGLVANAIDTIRAFNAEASRDNGRLKFLFASGLPLEYRIQCWASQYQNNADKFEGHLENQNKGNYNGDTDL